MSIAREFRDFAVKGNVVDLAVAVIIGAAFGKIVASLVSDIVMPLVGRYATSMEMTGMSLTILKLDDELEMLLKQPCDCPFWRVGA